MSKIVSDYVGFALLCSVIGAENSHDPLNQLNVKLKPVVTWTAALSNLLVLALTFHFVIICIVLIVVITLVLV